MELISVRGPMRSSGCSEITFTGALRRIGPSNGIVYGSRVGLVVCRSTIGSVTICSKSKTANFRKRRPVGKSFEEKRIEFATRKEELLRKSRGQLPQAEVQNQSEEHLDSSGTLVLTNREGALSVSVLQPIADRAYYPDSVKQPSDNVPSTFSGFVAQNRATRQGKDDNAPCLNKQQLTTGQRSANRGSRAKIEHTVSGRMDREHQSAAISEGREKEEEVEEEIEEEEEWMEVGMDDLGEEEVDDELVDYWEGDLPSMTAAEEQELLREAELELAELEKLGEFGVAHDLDEVASRDLKAVQMVQNGTRLNEGAKGTHADPEVKPNGGGEFVASGQELQHLNGSDEEIRIELKRLNLIPDHRVHRQDFWEWNDDEEEEVKEGRGVPAVMRCFDRAKIFVKAGDGGNGVVAFRREKYVPFGGPYGGNGGRGGNVYVEVDSSMNSLLPFRKAVHFRAGRGSHGGGKRKEGADGIDCTVKVPPGTLIRETGPGGKILLELTQPGQREMLLAGGTGGRGNAAFKTGRNNAPQLAEFGEEGPEMWIDLELKLVADVGIIGVPNAGKSTLLSSISAAQPEIANYPFTTLLPNLGVVALDFDATIVVADLPGLLEGAHTGIGLGHEFLRHTERCRVLVHVIDGMSPQPEHEFEAVRLELDLFNPLLSEKAFVVAFNKMDIPEASERWDAFEKYLCSKGVKPLCMSAATKQGTSEIITTAYELLKLQKMMNVANSMEDQRKALAVADLVRKQRSARIEDFTIREDTHTRTWQVIGAGLERFTQMTNWEYFESVRRFQRVLSACGVYNALREKGIQEGDTVIVGQMELNWIDSEDMSALAGWKKGTRGSKVWPH